ncbi:uncharacterized protein Plekhm1 [Venturia canescens]|uniref:uncharacterized protein Plekhm1 n=1 Tax=Venturia canescens TaxID=32260 RepID=UPI001C9D2407|nr:uncharacterized protein LOC122412962 [Venturia canescens]
MNTFLKRVHSRTSRRNNVVKDSLQKQLNLSVMEMQGTAGASEGMPVGNCDESMTLCSVLEAIFLHGLKDSLLNRVTEVLSGPDFEAMPQPSFWGPLLVFSHREIIDQIQGMSQITSEVGYCRAWIRLAMNQGLLSSYLASIRRDNSALKPYYERAAFIRDPDLVDVAQRLVESLDYVNFELACNSSLLNFWSNTPLLMAAIWAPPMKSCPVFSAVDIAKTIISDVSANDNIEDIETASSIGSLSSFNSSQSMLNNISSFSEDDAFKMILKRDVDDSPGAGARENNSPSARPAAKVYRLKKRKEEEIRTDEALPSASKSIKSREKVLAELAGSRETINEESERASTRDNEILSSENETTKNGDTSDEPEIAKDIEKLDVAGLGTIGNSLVGRPGWSTSLEDGESSMTASVISQTSVKTPGEGSTYDALIKSYRPTGYTTSPDLDEFLDKYNNGEEPVKSEPKPKPEIKVLDNLEDQIGILPQEKGLDVQNYSCFDCAHPIGMTFSKAHVCSFSGNYYCATCMANEEFFIPSRIIHNWDLKQYPVCRRVAKYLTDCPTLLNLKTLNPRIYTAVDSMAQLQSLRIRLNLLRAYLFTCREPVIESLQKRVAPREYLYEHVHQYSVSDLLDVPSGALAQQLQKIVELARQHVLNCWLCSQKGFICEVCNNPKVIYPFDMESTYRCNACNAVFHADCLSSSKPCPKCKRRRKRVDRPPPEIDDVDFVNSDAQAVPSSSAI